MSNSSIVTPMALLGIDEPLTADFLIGKWSMSDEFFRWGVTDREKAKLKTLKAHAFMCLLKDGSIKMHNLFTPNEGYWELTTQGLLIHDPRFPQRGSQLVPVRKRDNNRIWLLLPFSGGAIGIGMVRTREEELICSESSTAQEDLKRRENIKNRRSNSSTKLNPAGDEVETKGFFNSLFSEPDQSIHKRLKTE